MRTLIRRNEDSVKTEFFEKFPSGTITYKNDRYNNTGLFLWTERNMGGFKNAYQKMYGKQYVDARTSIDKTGKNSGGYKDGRCPERLRLRGIKEYKKWRTMVFERDKFTCQNCNKHSVYLEAHHIKPFAAYPELRFELTNGITYCRECHILLDDFRGKRGRKGAYLY